MFELERIQTHLQVVARGISCELDRVGDALHFLACHTAALFQVHERDDRAVREWTETKGFAVDSDGFYQSQHDVDAFKNKTLKDEALSYSWPASLKEDQDAGHRLFCQRNMGPLLMALHQRLPGAVWIYYQDITNTAFQYPFIDQKSAITPDFKWADYHTYRSVCPEVNPRREARWSPPHVDYAGQGLIVAGSIPVYVADQFVGLWSIDLQVDSLAHPSVLTPTRKSQVTCVVQRDGMVVASSHGVFCEDKDKGELALVSLAELHEVFHGLDLDEMFAQKAGCLPCTRTRDYLLYWVKLPSTDWMCLSALPSDALIEAAKNSFQRAFNSLGKGELGTALGIERLPNELVELGQAFNDMVSKLNLAHEQLLQQQEALAAEKLRAESANAAKTMFLGNMSHELRTPLNGVMGMHHLLKTTCLDAEQMEYVNLASQSCDRLTGLLSDILDVTRIESGKLALTKAPFNLGDVLHFTTQLFALSCQQKDITLTLSIDDTLEHSLIGDAMRLQQIINNLVGNAVKFTKHGNITITALRLSTCTTGPNRVLFSVADTGIGMNEDRISHLFEPFIQAEEGYEREYQGAGLGLSIVNMLVRLMKGSLDVESLPDEGTTIHVCLPFEVCEAQ